MSAWFAEFDRAVRRGLPGYVEDARQAGALPPPGLNLPYHAVSVAGWIVFAAFHTPAGSGGGNATAYRLAVRYP